jgi:hypothetical protein
MYFENRVKNLKLKKFAEFIKNFKKYIQENNMQISYIFWKQHASNDR